MKIAYLECATGISGDMMLAALIDSGVDHEAIQAGIGSLKLPGVQLHVRDVMKGCFRATSIHVEHPPQHVHRHFSDIVELIEQATDLTPSQRERAIQIFTALGNAEARVHGQRLESIHFHEVGAVDSIVDIVGTAIGFDLLGADEVVCGPIPTGQGEIRMAHGICPIPAPGTVELLRGVPLKDLNVFGELTTPTGAAIVRVFANRFGSRPEMTLTAVGCGAGTRDLPERANVLRLFVGEQTGATTTDKVCLLETNLDDVSGEVIGFVQHALFAAGAFDVYLTPITMKKNRPGVLLSILCSPHQQQTMEAILFRETGTLGIRHQHVQRSIQPRQVRTVQTPFGEIRGKISWKETGETEFSPEYEDCARIAADTGIPLREIMRTACRSFDQDFPTTSFPPT